MTKISLMKLLESMLNFEDAGDDADKLGLTHRGFGKYYDQQGNFVAKSVDGKLVKVGDQGGQETWTRPDGSVSTNRPPTKLHPSANMPVHPNFKAASAQLQQQRNQDAGEFDWPHSYEPPEQDEPMPSMASMISPDGDTTNWDDVKWDDPEYLQQLQADDEYDRNPGLYGPDVFESSEPAKGKKWKTNGVSHGEKGARIAPGTAKGDAYCARSNKIKGDWRDDPNSPNNLSRKKWKCRGDKSMKD